MKQSKSASGHSVPDPERVPAMNAAETTWRKRGRPVEVVAAVFESTRMLLMEMPLQAISFEVIAEKARVHKTTLYRRWGTPANLMAEVLNRISSERIPMPDTGSLEGDIRELVALYGEHFRSDLGVTINRILIDHRHTRIDGVDDWMEAHFRRQYESFAEVANRAVRRGEIRSIGEFMFAMELALGPMLMRSSLNGIPFDRDAEDKWTRVALAYLSLPPAAARNGH